MSADTVVPGAGNPQALNRYTYVLNNPLKYTDPTGHRYDPGGAYRKKPPPPPRDPKDAGNSPCDVSPFWILDSAPLGGDVEALQRVDRWLEDHPDYNPYLDPSIWTTNCGEAFPKDQCWYFVTVQYPLWRMSRGEGGILAQQVGQFPMTVLAGVVAIPESRSLSIYRYPQPGESFIRYETESFTRVTSNRGLAPGTFAAPSSEPLVTQKELPGRYALPRPEIPRTARYDIYPYSTDLVIGPRPVVGGTGYEVLFPFGTGPGTVFGPYPVPR